MPVISSGVSQEASDKGQEKKREFIMAEYEMYAIKYAGPFVSSGAFLMWNKDWEKTVKRNYYIWCIQGAGKTVIVDAGVSPQLASERNLNGYVSPTKVLFRINVQADEVRHVVITHPLGSHQWC